jgi:uncharacterized membrane protein YhfC
MEYPRNIQTYNWNTGCAQLKFNISKHITEVYIHVTVLHRNGFLFNNQPDALIIQIYSVKKLYMFRASSPPIIRNFLLYIRHW